MNSLKLLTFLLLALCAQAKSVKYAEDKQRLAAHPVQPEEQKSDSNVSLNKQIVSHVVQAEQVLQQQVPKVTQVEVSNEVLDQGTAHIEQQQEIHQLEPLSAQVVANGEISDIKQHNVEPQNARQLDIQQANPQQVQPVISSEVLNQQAAVVGQQQEIHPVEPQIIQQPEIQHENLQQVQPELQKETLPQEVAQLGQQQEIHEVEPLIAEQTEQVNPPQIQPVIASAVLNQRAATLEQQQEIHAIEPQFIPQPEIQHANLQEVQPDISNVQEAAQVEQQLEMHQVEPQIVQQPEIQQGNPQQVMPNEIIVPESVNVEHQLEQHQVLPQISGIQQRNLQQVQPIIASEEQQQQEINQVEPQVVHQPESQQGNPQQVQSVIPTEALNQEAVQIGQEYQIHPVEPLFIQQPEVQQRNLQQVQSRIPIEQEQINQVEPQVVQQPEIQQGSPQQIQSVISTEVFKQQAATLGQQQEVHSVEPQIIQQPEIQHETLQQMQPRILIEQQQINQVEPQVVHQSEIQQGNPQEVQPISPSEALNQEAVQIIQEQEIHPVEPHFIQQSVVQQRNLQQVQLRMPIEQQQINEVEPQVGFQPEIQQADPQQVLSVAPRVVVNQETEQLGQQQEIHPVEEPKTQQGDLQQVQIRIPIEQEQINQDKAQVIHQPEIQQGTPKQVQPVILSEALNQEVAQIEQEQEIHQQRQQINEVEPEAGYQPEITDKQYQQVQHENPPRRHHIEARALQQQEVPLENPQKVQTIENPAELVHQVEHPIKEQIFEQSNAAQSANEHVKIHDIQDIDTKLKVADNTLVAELQPEGRGKFPSEFIIADTPSTDNDASKTTSNPVGVTDIPSKAPHFPLLPSLIFGNIYGNKSDQKHSNISKDGAPGNSTHTGKAGFIPLLPIPYWKPDNAGTAPGSAIPAPNFYGLYPKNEQTHQQRSSTNQENLTKQGIFLVGHIYLYKSPENQTHKENIKVNNHTDTPNIKIEEFFANSQLLLQPVVYPTTNQTREALPSATAQERRFFGILRAGKRKNVVLAPPSYRQNGGDTVHAAEAAAPVGYSEASTLDLQVQLQAQQNDYVVLEAPAEEVSHRRLRSPPPPFYCPLPLTPPPCYTERPPRGATATATAAAAAAAAPTQPAAEHAAARAAATVAVAAEAAARQQARRRRRLRELQQQQQQQQQQLQRFAASTNSSSNSSSDQSSDCELGSAARRQRRRRRSSSRGLRDAYCPDLLHACALILHQQQPGSSDSSVGNFTATPPPPPLPPQPPAHIQSQAQLPSGDSIDYSSDYVEIDELLPLAAGRAKSTPQLQHAVALADCLAMGQNLSLRRPRISLTWVLREQHQQPQPQAPSSQSQTNETDYSGEQKEKEPLKLTNGHVMGTAVAQPEVGQQQQRTEPVPTQLDVTKKRYRVKQLPGGTEPLNGYATTPTAHQTPGNGQLANQKFFSNQNLLDYKDKATRCPPAGAPVPTASTKELLFVCTPQRAPKGDVHSEALLLARKRNEIRKKLANRLQQARSVAAANCGEATARSTATATATTAQAQDALKCTYSEPSLVAVSEGGGVAAPQQQRRHRHRKRRERERNRAQRFGYEIHNVDEFLSRCSLAAPGNIPVVLATASTLYQTRPGGYQLEIPLPLGMVVNAVFKNQNWLYVQTPHAEEGYVGYACCLPLGILPSAARSSKHTPCWESNADIFPRPCGNMTDSEKEIRLRGGTRSDGARTPRNAKPTDELLPHNNNNNNNNNNVSGKSLVAHNVGGSLAGSLYGEQHVDRLYLRAASQPKLVEKAYAQLRSTKQLSLSNGAGSCSASVRSASNDEYVTLQQQRTTTTVTSVKQQQLLAQKHLHHQPQSHSQQSVRRLSSVSYITNGHNGQHLHPKSIPSSQQPQQQQQQQHLHQHQPPPPAAAAATAAAGAVLSVLRRQQQNGLRQTLVAINSDYITDSIVVHKGEIVTLCECRESKDQRQWFYVKTRDGREGFIPAEVAGHGYL